jgi:hypothetical protein
MIRFLDHLSLAGALLHAIELFLAAVLLVALYIGGRELCHLVATRHRQR